ncbi:MAG: hypothetical protein FJW95_14135 [Actinobacteria bacterium]|nr:hypothetical protein [Actinomycetota bacterium]
MSPRTATTVWRLTPELVLALDARLGPPVDGYVNGTQTWLTEGGPGRETLEWRLHPVSGFRPPRGVGPYDLWDEVTGQLAAGADPGSLPLGDDRRPLASLWDGLECYPVDDPLEPAPLAAAAADALGIPADAVGLVDHARIGNAWERARGTVSIIALLLEELQAPVEGDHP